VYKTLRVRYDGTTNEERREDRTMDEDMEQTTVALGVAPHRAYGASDVETQMTLGDLMRALEEAVSEYGEDARLVTRDDSNAYGAAWGHLDSWGDLFRAVGSDEEE
jgi:hypothetical protein